MVEQADSLIHFLKAILPDNGVKIWTSIKDKKAVNHFCTSIEELAAQILANDALGIDTYHACGTFKTDQNRRAANAGWFQCFFADVDVGEGKPYATIEAAIQAVDDFCNRVSVLVPGIVRSGGGVHIYWPLDRTITREEWRPVAQRLKLLMPACGLHADLSRTADAASILRSPGTHNYKISGQPRSVEVDDWNLFEPISADEFIIAVMNTPLVPAPTSTNNNLTAGISKAFDPTVGVTQGYRGSTQLRYAGELVAKGYDEAEVIARCMAWNQLCTPPQDEKEVRRIVRSAFTMQAQKYPSPMLAASTDIWPEPSPLTEKLKAKPYPLDALPDTIRAAVKEVHGFVQAPVAMVASSALATVSLAIQCYIDVKRAERLTGPTGLYFLTVADSGERKTTCDKYFMPAIQKYEKEEEERAKPEIREYQAKLKAWKAKCSGLGDSIRSKTSKGVDTKVSEHQLIELEKKEPVPPTVPRLTYSDATPEALTWSLAKIWPSGGVISSEGGIVFGAHGMNKETIMRSLSTLNILWDGGNHQSDRRTSESYSLHGARLTMALQVQEVTLRSFFEQSKGQARGSGFLARFLVSHPESTQGFRPFVEPANWPCLEAFNHRITEILKFPPPIMADGSLVPTVISLTPAAKAAWIKFYNDIEMELRPGGELEEVRDVASKITDNAVRVAALFQYFEKGAGAIELKNMESACRIVTWYLYEARRFFREIALPVDIMSAQRVDRWLLGVCQKKKTNSIPLREAQQYGPVRLKNTLQEALQELSELGRARIIMNGKQKDIQINPTLLTGSP